MEQWTPPPPSPAWSTGTDPQTRRPGRPKPAGSLLRGAVETELGPA
ncbi:hypothetical protein [Streptomyces tubercidicus]